MNSAEVRAHTVVRSGEGWANASGSALPWWLTPLGLVALIPLPALNIAAIVSPASYRELWRVEKIIDGATTWMFLLGLLAFVIGTFLARPLRGSSAAAPGTESWPSLSDHQIARLRIAHRRCLIVTLVGYVVYLGVAVLTAGPSRYLRVLFSGENYDGLLKDLAPSIPGITTLSQVGVLVAIISELLFRITKEKAFRRWIYLLVALAAFRSFFYTERLAMIEVIVPVMVIGFTFAWRNGTAKQRRQLVLAPVFALPLLVTAFGVFEHSRSWVFYREFSNQSYPEFVGKRLAGYYATSYNNGALLTTRYNDNFPRMPYFTLDAIWNAPVIGQTHAYRRITGEEGLERWDNMLDTYANPEFNSPCAIAGAFTDYGPIGGMLFLGLFGFAVGLIWRRFDDARPIGLLLYPIAVVAVIELPRYSYLTAGRATPALVFGIVTAMWLRRERTNASLPRVAGRTISARQPT